MPAVEEGRSHTSGTRAQQKLAPGNRPLVLQPYHPAPAAKAAALAATAPAATQKWTSADLLQSHQAMQTRAEQTTGQYGSWEAMQQSLGVKDPPKQEAPEYTRDGVKDALDALMQAGAARSQPGEYDPSRPAGEPLQLETKAPSVNDATLKLEAAERAQRMRTLGIENSKPHGEVKPMTWEEYNALTPSERSAVDFNTMLVRAVRRDNHQQDNYDPSAKEQKTYDTTVETMFGEGRGSDLYAPETLSVLKQIDFKDDTSDLDDFLQLKAAITSRDIKKNLDTVTGFWTHDNAITPQADRQQLVQTLADSTRAAQEEVLAKGNEMLASINKTALVDRNLTVDELGGLPKDPLVDLGFGPARVYKVGEHAGAPKDLNTFFQQLFSSSADGSAPKGVPQASLGAANLKPEELDAWFNYADTRLTNAENFDLDLAKAGPDVKTPEEFRKMFGLDKGDDNG